jgi:hypothetical protein
MGLSFKQLNKGGESLAKNRLVAHCANPKCKWPIYKGDVVWRKGYELFCHSDCLIESFKPKRQLQAIK